MRKTMAIVVLATALLTSVAAAATELDTAAFSKASGLTLTIQAARITLSEGLTLACRVKTTQFLTKIGMTGIRKGDAVTAIYSSKGWTLTHVASGQKVSDISSMLPPF